VQQVGTVQRDRRHQRLWVLKYGVPTPIPVTVGPSDGRLTAIVEGDVQPGLEVITDLAPHAR